jgi:hypothetical protein
MKWLCFIVALVAFLNVDGQKTQKELLVKPDIPQFLRQGDHIELSARIVNGSDSELTGQVQLELFSATTHQSVDGWFLNTFPNQYFTVSKGKSEEVKFPLQVPMQYLDNVVWRITARSGSHLNVQEDSFQVLTNKVSKTEAFITPVYAEEKRNFTFQNLLQSANDEEFQNHALTVEFSSAPALYAMQALNRLMHPDDECSEQIWNSYFARSLYSKFSQFASTSNAALKQSSSGSSEEDGRQELLELKNIQNADGSFPWFKAGKEDPYITQYILIGMGRLKKLNAVPEKDRIDFDNVLGKALKYAEARIKEDYERLTKSKADKQEISILQAQYLYMRSFFPEKEIENSSQTALNFYKRLAEFSWQDLDNHLQAMIALTSYRNGNEALAKTILDHLKKSALIDEEYGMYWKSYRQWANSRFSPVETQSLIIEAFAEITGENEALNQLRKWLIKNKGVDNWGTTKATADACYALLSGAEWTDQTPHVKVHLGSLGISNYQSNPEKDVSYFRQSISGRSIQPEMGNIATIVKPGKSFGISTSSPSWLGVYWQYFSNAEKDSASPAFRLTRELLVERKSKQGSVFVPVENTSALQVGDNLKVRISLYVDEDMNYVHLHDERASALQLADTTKGYKQRGSVTYYRKADATSVDCFFDHLNKGRSYVFEYALVVKYAGSFDDGIATIQCMYAPQLKERSTAARINIE